MPELGLAARGDRVLAVAILVIWKGYVGKKLGYISKKTLFPTL